MEDLQYFASMLQSAFNRDTHVASEEQLATFAKIMSSNHWLREFFIALLNNFETSDADRGMPLTPNTVEAHLEFFQDWFRAIAAVFPGINKPAALNALPPVLRKESTCQKP